jgi:transcriptional regulator with XRE-family HTH domain
MIDEKEFGKIIKFARKANNWTTRDLLKAMKRETWSGYILHIEQKQEIPSVVSIKELAQALGLDVQKLFDAAKITKIAKYTRLMEAKYR